MAALAYAAPDLLAAASQPWGLDPDRKALEGGVVRRPPGDAKSTLCKNTRIDLLASNEAEHGILQATAEVRMQHSPPCSAGQVQPHAHQPHGRTMCGTTTDQRGTSLQTAQQDGKSRTRGRGHQLSATCNLASTEAGVYSMCILCMQAIRVLHRVAGCRALAAQSIEVGGLNRAGRRQLVGGR